MLDGEDRWGQVFSVGGGVSGRGHCTVFKPGNSAGLQQGHVGPLGRCRGLTAVRLSSDSGSKFIASIFRVNFCFEIRVLRTVQQMYWG